MKVFVAGATGAIGRPLVARLLRDGHQVTGMSRTAEGAAMLEGLGARGIVADALDAEAVTRAVLAAAPEVVHQQLTALPQAFERKAMRDGYFATDRLRYHGTRNLVAAAQEAGARRVVAQSLSLIYAPTGGWVKREDDALYLDAEQGAGDVIRGISEMEQDVVAAGGVALRYGWVYGPGTWFDRRGAIGQLLAARRYPVVGNGAGTYSFLHVDDAVDAAVVAMEGGKPGIYNVADDHPAPMREWAPLMATALGTRRPRKVPAWMARLAAGPLAVFYATQVRGVNSARFKSAFGWEPGVPD